MGADPDTVLPGEAHGRTHVVEVGGVETTGDVGGGDERHQSGIVAGLVEAEALAHVAIDDRHGSSIVVTPPGRLAASSGVFSVAGPRDVAQPDLVGDHR